MHRVTGIGGSFLRARAAATLRAWYAEHLGIDITDCEGNRFELWQPPPGS
jgi:predicted enzyme related to lactoylglutathione lyase